MANFQKNWDLFFFAEKNFRIHKPKISVVNSDFFFCPPPKRSPFFWKFAVLAPRSTKNYSNRPASWVEKKFWSWALPLKSPLRDSKIRRFVALVWSMLALIPVKKSTALLQTAITFVPSLRLSWFFVLIPAEFDRLSEKLSRRDQFSHPAARCCVDCRRFLAWFCL